MTGKLKKMGCFARRVVREFAEDSRFSVKLAFFRMCETVFGRIGVRKVAAWGTKGKHRHVQAILSQVETPVLEQFAEDSNFGIYQANAPIWVCWWTGEDSAPPLVKRCLASIRANAGTHPVNLITQDNFREYVTIPEGILEELENKTMCVAHMSDYLRFSLLEKFGGLWLDATIYCTGPIPETIFRMPLFTCKGGNQSLFFVSNYRWTTFCFGGNRGHVLFRYIRRALEQYWQDKKWTINYLLLDYLIDLGYTKLPGIRASLDGVPENNLSRDRLADAMRGGLPAKSLEEALDEGTVLYKLSWREPYPMQTAQGEDTVYAAFLEVGILDEKQ